VQVDPHAEAGLVDREEPTQPRRKEPHHPGVTVREHDLAVTLGALACVQRGARDEEFTVAELADAAAALCESSSISACFRSCNRFGARRRPRRRGPGVNSTSRSQSDTELSATPSWVAMSSNVMPAARSSRAFVCSASFPP
jgi:hypothetical protein